jgi:hypothetical protein
MRSGVFRCALLIPAAAALLLATSCASTRGVIDYPLPTSQDLGEGPAVRIGNVVDARGFERNPSDPSIPSLKDGEIEDRAITSRAIARKRNGYGKAMGDILLPEGRTVVELASAAVVRGLREGGYRVLAQGDAGYDDATPIDVEIRKFWMWFTPGFWAAHLEFRSALGLRGPIPPLAGGAEAVGYVRLATQAATSRAWTNTLDRGLADLNVKIVELLQAAAPEAPVPTAEPPAASPAPATTETPAAAPESPAS